MSANRASVFCETDDRRVEEAKKEEHGTVFRPVNPVITYSACRLSQYYVTTLQIIANAERRLFVFAHKNVSRPSREPRPATVLYNLIYVNMISIKQQVDRVHGGWVPC